ncbi:MAG: DUF6263 family protein [Candidatus Alcyoniella australis]|nr:DUF6263 family protein [Candidatus Alcyoniella australis]
MIISRRTAWTLSIALCLAMVATAAVAGELESKFKPGDKLGYVQTMNLQMSLTMFGSSLGDAQTKRTIEFDREVLKPNDQKRRRIQITVRSVQLEETSQGEPAKTYSTISGDEPGAPEQQLYAALVNKPVVVVLDNKNNVVQVDGREALVESVQSKISTPEDKQAVAGEFDSLFSDTTDIGALVNIRDLDPQKKVKPGDSWEKIWGGEVVDADTMPAQITLKSREGDLAKLEYAVKTDDLRKTLEQPANPGDPPTKVDRLKVEGNIDFNTNSGTVVRSEDLIDMAMSMGEEGQATMSMAITATIILQVK